MPLEDALSFISKNLPAADPTPPRPASRLDPPVERRGVKRPSSHPDDIMTILGFINEDRPLSVMEYDKMIKYLAAKREEMLRQEYGDNVPSQILYPPIGPKEDPVQKEQQDRIQDRVMTLLNRTQPEPPQASAAGSSISGGGGVGVGLPPTVQQAIDSLVKSGPNILSGIKMATGQDGTGGMGAGGFGQPASFSAY